MRFYLLLSTAVVLLNNSSAYASNLEVNLGTHTPNLLLELKSTPLFDNTASFKVAAICGLGGDPCSRGLEFNYDSSSGGEAGTGSSKKCSTGYIFVNNKGCMLDRCPSGYSPNACTGSTPVQLASTTVDSGRLCYQCRAENCSDYPITAACPINGTCSNCPDNDSKKKLVSCTANYKVSENNCIIKTCPTDISCSSSEVCVDGTCQNDTCPLGYQKSNLCSNGIEDSKNNTAGIPCYKCKTCSNLGTLSSCPTNAVCTLEACSGKFYITGCAIGAKDADSYWCNISTVKCYIPITQKCVTPPTCDDLGYKQTSSQCSGKPTLKCPFDNTKLFCLN